jgi:hypothetical protein
VGAHDNAGVQAQLDHVPAALASDARGPLFAAKHRIPFDLDRVARNSHWQRRQGMEPDRATLSSQAMKAAAKTALLVTLRERFAKHAARHPKIDWQVVQARLESNEKALQTLHAMEASGGEPDVIGYDKKADLVTFCDCAPETPQGRRSLCYDREALDSRKQNKPSGNAVEMAAAMGAELLTEEQYRELQRLGEFDLKTSSWIHTPPAVRDLGGALFCDRRFGQVFVYHNGAESYYAVRGFRTRFCV